MPSQPKTRSVKQRSNLEQIKPNAAGIDIGATEHWVCVPADRTTENVRCFGCFTPDLKAMADWLIECGVETVAMESTSVDWIPPFQMLEARGLEVFLVNALRSHLYRISGVDFTTIDGLDVLTVQTIISEVGLDPNRFPTVKQFTSWLGLSPGCRITGGKVKSSTTRSVVNRAATAFRLAAQAVGRSNSALGAFYRRLRSRLGAPKAITATAHKLARMFYYMWRRGETYTDPGVDYYEQKYQERVVNHLKKKAQSLGFELVPQSSSA